MKTTSFITATSLLALSSAATVSLETTACLDPSYPTEAFSMTLNPSKAIPKALKTVCGLRIVSVSGADLNSVKCQAFRDREGTLPGSAVFTYESPARIATNPVQERSILCTGTEDAVVDKRQILNATASLDILTVFPSTTLSVPLTGTPSAASSGASSVDTSVVVITSLASSGTALPTPGSNSTLSSATLKSSTDSSTSPSASPSASDKPNAAAGAFNVGLGVVGAAVLALFA